MMTQAARNTNNKDRQDRKVLIPTFQTIEICCIKNMLYIEAFENYCKVFFNNRDSITSSQSFGSFCNQVMDTGFFQCHKSYTVNFSYVKRYLKVGSVELENEKLLPVARRRKDDFVKALKEWCILESTCSNRSDTYNTIYSLKENHLEM